MQFGRARPGGGPALGLTLGASVGAAEFLGPSTISLRILGGVELPFAVYEAWPGGAALELVPAIKIGYLRAFEEDERDGLTFRGAVGLRVLPGGGAFYFTFEPLALVALPSPGAGFSSGGSQLALELGVVKVGWRL